MYPTKAEINGKEYKINTSWQNALECFEIINDDTICDEERALAIVYKIFGFIPDNNFETFLKKAQYFLQCGETVEEQNAKEVDMDFNQDLNYISASFMSDYHIDLSKEDIHFWQFISFIKGLTENSALSRIRKIRNYDISDFDDPKVKSAIIEAKKHVELKNTVKISKEKQEAQQRFFELAHIRR